MTRNEFVTQRTAELPKRNVAAADVVEEYQQHVSFKLADGYIFIATDKPVRNGTLRC